MAKLMENNSRPQIIKEISTILGDNWEYYFDTDYLPNQYGKEDEKTNIMFKRKRNSHINQEEIQDQLKILKELNYGDVSHFRQMGVGYFIGINLYASFKSLDSLYEEYLKYKEDNDLRIDSVRKVVNNNVPTEFIEHYCFFNQ